MTQEKMDRISELTRIARERDLTPDEQAERKTLREEYIADWRRSTIDVLENTYIDHGDGRVTKLPKKAHLSGACDKCGTSSLDKCCSSCYTRYQSSPSKGHYRKEPEQCVFAAATASRPRSVRRPVVVVRKAASLSAGSITAAGSRPYGIHMVFTQEAARFLRFLSAARGKKKKIEKEIAHHDAKKSAARRCRTDRQRLRDRRGAHVQRAPAHARPQGHHQDHRESAEGVLPGVFRGRHGVARLG